MRYKRIRRDNLIHRFFILYCKHLQHFSNIVQMRRINIDLKLQSSKYWQISSVINAILKQRYNKYHINRLKNTKSFIWVIWLLNIKTWKVYNIFCFLGCIGLSQSLWIIEIFINIIYLVFWRDLKRCYASSLKCKMKQEPTEPTARCRHHTDGHPLIKRLYST